jgi:hypothetical protein
MRSAIGFGTSLFCAFVFLSLRLSSFAQSAPPTAVSMATAHPDFSGFWEKTGGLGVRGRGAAVKLTPKAEAHDKRVAAERAEGRVVVYASRWCNYLGVPFMMQQSPPINILQGNDEIVIFAEMYSAARHIYLDGRGHPDAAAFVPATNGHSVTRWEGDELVVDTTNFNGKGHSEIPGGGYRTPTSHLVENFKLSNDGKALSITSTWTDPEIFLEPVTYTVNYHKLPPATYAYEDFCDASDPTPYDYSGSTGTTQSLSAPDADQ